MNPGRRAFLQTAFQISGGVVGLSATGAVLAKRMAPILDETRIHSYVAGVPFHIGMHTRPGRVFHRGQFLHLRPEPDNPHDANALAVYAGRSKVGYIPRKDNALIGRHLRQGGVALVKVSAVNDLNAWEGVRIVVTLG